MKTKLLLFLLLLPIQVFALEASVELAIKKDSMHWVSQKMVATLTIKTNALSIGDLRVKTHQNNEFIIIKPGSAAYKTSEKMDDETWQLTVYEYVIYPLRSGEIKLNAFDVEFSAAMGYGQEKKAFALRTQPVTLQINKPEGMKDKQFVLSTTSMTVDVTYTPEIDSLKVGEAFERQITITAVDVPDFLLQPIPEYQSSSEKSAAFKFYRSEPVLTEKQQQNKITARRKEHDTFVASHAGKVTLPEIKMYWFEPQKQKLHTETIPARTLTIMVNPLIQEIPTDQNSDFINESGLSKQMIIWLLLLIVCFGITAKWWLPRLVKYQRTRKQVFETSLSGRYQQFEKACHGESIQKIYQAFYLWAKLAMPDVKPLSFAQIGLLYPELKSSLLLLEAALAGKKFTHQEFDVRLFKRQVKHIHRFLLQQKINIDHQLLDTLNPGHKVSL